MLDTNRLSNGFHRTSLIAAIYCGLANIMYATREGFLYSWSYLSSGWIVKKTIACWMVKFGLGELLSNFSFTIVHSTIMTVIAYVFFNITGKAITWVVSGFLSSEK